MKNKESCIYAIKNVQTNQLYIGKTINYQDRIYYHKSYLKKNNHYNKYLQRSWNKYGEDNFEFYVVEFCEESFLDEKEIFYIEKYKSNIRKFGFNLTNGGEGTAGYKYTDEQKEKRSGSNNPMWNKKGENHPAFGYIHSEETRKIISKSKIGIPRPDHVISILKSFTWEGKIHPTKGRKHTDEEKKKMKDNHPDFTAEKHPRWGKKKKGSSSIYIGVCYNKKNKKWIASLKSPLKVHIGSFSSEVEAAKSYNLYVIENNLPNPLNNIEE